MFQFVEMNSKYWLLISIANIVWIFLREIKAYLFIRLTNSNSQHILYYQNHQDTAICQLYLVGKGFINADF